MSLAETYSLPEVLWTIFGVVGLGTFGVLTLRAYSSLRVLAELGLNGGRRIAGRTTLGIESGFCLTQLIVIVSGILQGLAPPARAGVPMPYPAVVATVAILSIEVILIAVGIFSLVRGDVLDRYFAVHDSTAADATSRERHAETMVELVHNTEVTTEARDGAVEAYQAAANLHEATNNLNDKIIDVQERIAETNRVAGESAESLEKYMRKLEGQRQDREGC